MYFAYLDLGTVQAAYAASPDESYEALWRLTHRGVEVMLIAPKRNQQTFDWLCANKLSYADSYACLYQNECFSLFDRLRKRVPTFMEWKQDLAKSCQRSMDLDIERSGRTERTLFIDQDEHVHQAIIDLYDPRIGAYSSLQEAVESFEPLPEWSEREVVRYHILRKAHKKGLIDTTPQLLAFLENQGLLDN